MQRRWDIFCKVVDNYGDIGVCWRLAKQLAFEYQQKVRLWVDDLQSFNAIEPNVKLGIISQIIRNIEVRHWQSTLVQTEPAEIVIEAFACELPDAYVAKMAQQEKQPVWINLEYLSAEPWVAQYHALPSPHPRFPLNKTFFFPGFVKGTGGLLREKQLMVQRDAFGVTEESAFFQRMDLSERKPGELRIALFCYENAPVQELIQLLIQSSIPTLLIVPQGNVAQKIVTQLNKTIHLKQLIKLQSLTIQITPMMEQVDYDRLLWSCDLNFVRGEDSFVRAQWAGHPFVWNIYAQADGVHWQKLDAYLDLYTADMPREMDLIVRAFWSGWNGRIELTSKVWMNFLSIRESLEAHHKKWIYTLWAQDDLAANLVQFAENQL